jgi:uncharacterized membrane protein
MTAQKTYFSRTIAIALLLFTFFLGGAHVHAQESQSELSPPNTSLMKARVVSVEKQEVKDIPGTDVQSTYQTINAVILDGVEQGKTVTIEDDYLSLNVGEVFYAQHTIGMFDGVDYYSVSSPYRLPQLGWLIGLFVVVVCLFGGMQGVRGLLSLIGSFLFIFYLLLPGILHGYSPLLVTVVVSSFIIIVSSYITHGFTRSTSSAVIGMILTVTITGILAYFSVHFTRLTGFGSEEVMYLNLNTRGGIDIIGLLLGGMIIGLLGVLYDAAIGQSVSVEELVRVAPHVSRRYIYTRAIRIGREHIGALVNTLAIAYVGVSLPLLLLFYQTSNATLTQIINNEMFVTEIVRMMIGSIGLVLAVPITTFVSVLLLTKKPSDIATPTLLAAEKKGLEHAGHSHGHTH